MLTIDEIFLARFANFLNLSIRCKLYLAIRPLSKSQLRHQKSYTPNFLARKSACAFLNTKALRICLRIACSAASPS